MPCASYLMDTEILILILTTAQQTLLTTEPHLFSLHRTDVTIKWDMESAYKPFIVFPMDSQYSRQYQMCAWYFPSPSIN